VQISAAKKDLGVKGGTRAIRRVLVVDDSRLQRRILCSILLKWDLEIVEAESAEEALEYCKSSPPDLILSDWMMPGMNGLEFCSVFRALETDRYGYFILLTSKSEKNEIAQGLDAGADDFLTKPVNPNELRARISAGDRILGMERQLSDKNKVITETLGKLQDAYDSIDRDLQQAKNIQESLVPDRVRSFGASRVSLLLNPCGHIGGDLAGMFAPGPGHVGFYSVDVSGHGITSAMMTARLGGYLSSTYFDQNLAMERCEGAGYILREPEAVTELLNERLSADTGVEEYFTMAYATVDLSSGRLKMVQAGHPHPLIMRADGRAEFVGNGGVPIGLLPDIPYQRFETKLEKGDRVFLYTDGFTECEMLDGEMLGEDGLLQLIDQCETSLNGKEFLDDLFWTLTQNMKKGSGLEDDVSATLFEYKGA